MVKALLMVMVPLVYSSRTLPPMTFTTRRRLPDLSR